MHSSRRVSTESSLQGRRPFTSTAASRAQVSVQHQQRPVMASGAKIVRGVKWAVPVLAVGALGVAGFEELQKKRREQAELASADMRRQQQFMDSYGDRMTLEDMQKAVEAYERSK